ncbi:MAG: ribonucleotide reductase N-terminal alpha domain-containing protein, partial [Brevundimonas sp.]
MKVARGTRFPCPPTHACRLGNPAPPPHMEEGSVMDFSGDREASMADVDTGTVAPKKSKAAKPDSKSVKPLVYPVEVDHSRDALLTEFGKETLKDRYLLPGESFQDLFVRVASAYADNAEHAQRVYDYISRLWFMPATPVLSNGGTGRGLPISCYLNSVDDSL